MRLISFMVSFSTLDFPFPLSLSLFVAFSSFHCFLFASFPLCDTLQLETDRMRVVFFSSIETDWSFDWQFQEKSHDIQPVAKASMHQHPISNWICMCWKWTKNFGKLKNSLHDKVISISITIVIALSTYQAVDLQWIFTFWHLAIAFEIQSIIEHIKCVDGHQSAYCIVEVVVYE